MGTGPAERGAIGRQRRRGGLALRHPFRREKRNARVLAAYALAAVAVAVARPTAAWLAGGAVLLALGTALRVWAAGHLHKNQALTVSGPYAFSRHPLYAGALLIGAGLAVASGPTVAIATLPSALAFFFAYYLPAKERAESQRLEGLYGDAFRRYAAAVPAFWPRLRPWTGLPAGVGWRAGRVVANNEHSVVLWAFAGLGTIAVRMLG